MANRTKGLGRLVIASAPIAASVVIMSLGTAPTAIAITGVNAPIFGGENVFSDGPAKGLDENYIGTATDDYVSPNGSTAFGSNSENLHNVANNALGGAFTPTANQGVGMTESIRVDRSGRSMGVNLATGTPVQFADGIQGMNIPQPMLLPGSDVRNGSQNLSRSFVADPNNGGVFTNIGDHSARIGAVGFYAENNPSGGDFEFITPAGSSTAQAYGLTVFRTLAASVGGLVDDGLAPGSTFESGNPAYLAIPGSVPIPDFLPFDAFAAPDGTPQSPRQASLSFEFIDRGNITATGGDPDGAEAPLIARYRLYDDAVTPIVPESPPLLEENFKHDTGNQGLTVEAPGIDEVTDGLLLLGGEIFNAAATLTWTETGVGTGDFLWDISFTGSVQFDEGKIFDDGLLQNGVGSIGAQWSNIPFNLLSDGFNVGDLLSTNGVILDGVFADVSNVAVNMVDAGGWDFLVEDAAASSDYDFDAFRATDVGDPRFPTIGGGNNSVTFQVVPLDEIPEPVTSGLASMALVSLGAYLRRRLA